MISVMNTNKNISVLWGLLIENVENIRWIKVKERINNGNI